MTKAEHSKERTYVHTYIRTGQTLYPLHNEVIKVTSKLVLKDGRPYLFHSFRNKYFNKISLGNMLYFQNKL